MDHVECVVVGAGVVGLAIARELALRGREVLCLEAAAALGAGTTGRGSGVIHAGLYYPSGSLKARLCVAGRDSLYAYAAAHDIPCVRRGKLVVATAVEEEAALADIAERAAGNGVGDLRCLDGAQARRLEPALSCCAALLSPSTGVIDARALLATLQADAEEHGAVLAFQAPLGRVGTEGGDGFVLDVGGAAPMRIGCRTLINAAGHGAPAVARGIEGLEPRHVPRQHYAKGNYVRCTVPVPFAHLIYPLPVPGGIGTHLTIDAAGAARVGPDVEWVDGLDYAVDPARVAGFAADVRRWWPALPDGVLVSDGAGVRPKIAGPGEPARDFVIAGADDHGVSGLVNLFGIESPGLTSSLAIATHVAAMV